MLKPSSPANATLGMHGERAQSGVQRFERYIRCGQHNLEQGGSGTGWVAAMLLPILKGFDADLH